MSGSQTETAWHCVKTVRQKPYGTMSRGQTEVFGSMSGSQTKTTWHHVEELDRKHLAPRGIPLGMHHVKELDRKRLVPCQAVRPKLLGTDCVKELDSNRMAPCWEVRQELLSTVSRILTETVRLMSGSQTETTWHCLKELDGNVQLDRNCCAPGEGGSQTETVGLHVGQLDGNRLALSKRGKTVTIWHRVKKLDRNCRAPCQAVRLKQLLDTVSRSLTDTVRHCVKELDSNGWAPCQAVRLKPIGVRQELFSTISVRQQLFGSVSRSQTETVSVLYCVQEQFSSSLITRPFAGGGRVWACAYIRIVHTNCSQTGMLT